MKNLLGRESKGLTAWLIAIFAIGGLTTSAVAGESDWFSAMSEQQASVVNANAEMEEAPADAESSKMIPWLTVGVSFDLVSDYIWRGINFSEFPGEGREDPNYQLGLDVSVDLAQVSGVEMLGTLGANIWFEWFSQQENLTPWSGNNLQEVDYTLYYSHGFGEIGLDVTVGWIAYHFPRLRDSGAPAGSGDAAYTQELFVELAWDDSMIFGQPLLNPTMSYYHDVDDVQAGMLFFGVSHDFVLADYGCKEMPVLKDMVVSPSATLAVDHRYYDKSGNGGGDGPTTKLAYLEYGLSMAVDLNSALNIPSQYGAFSVGGFLNFVQAFHDDSPLVNDQLYGGMNVSWEF
ncbi:MAG: hypothetical protein ACLFUJ_14245 [Phycisphaerae bacterium]